MRIALSLVLAWAIRPVPSHLILKAFTNTSLVRCSHAINGLLRVTGMRLVGGIFYTDAYLLVPVSFTLPACLPARLPTRLPACLPAGDLYSAIRLS